MTKRIENRIGALEKKANPEGEYQVIVNWDPDPKPPKDKTVKVVRWDDNDNLETT